MRFFSTKSDLGQPSAGNFLLTGIPARKPLHLRNGLSLSLARPTSAIMV
jgi:hypothetical protein